MKAIFHAKISAKKFGGKWDDYIDIHAFLDQCKAHIPDSRHRLVLHNSWGVALVGRVFGDGRYNSANRLYSPQAIAEQHILEDMGTIRPLSETMKDLPRYSWAGFRQFQMKTIKIEE